MIFEVQFQGRGVQISDFGSIFRYLSTFLFFLFPFFFYFLFFSFLFFFFFFASCGKINAIPYQVTVDVFA
jgi:hypothetical protein